jgi:DNA polymerase I-like protein with 3'-5' exonuclease and polymerase domains
MSKKEQDELRDQAKATNFGVIYGIGPEGLVEQLWKLGIKVTVERAAELLEVFERTYPKLMENREDFVALCLEHKKIVIGKNWKKGRGRAVPLYRQEDKEKSPKTRACNYGVQGRCADVSMNAFAATDRRLIAEGLDARVVIWAHDELIVEARIGADAERAKVILKEEMEKAFLDEFPEASVALDKERERIEKANAAGLSDITLVKLVDVKTGPNWAVVKAKPPKPENAAEPPPDDDDDETTPEPAMTGPGDANQTGGLTP